ncbi:MAG: hypothetical protein RBU21_15435, partial [FCB group bacterium]|nr:hypothetical protein [FCB group bacterium]
MLRFQWVLLLLWAGIAGAAEGPSSPLGLEPGTRRLCNDDLGVIVWGPDSAPTLSVGKSDVWDRRLPAGENRIITLKELIEGAKNSDPAIVKGAPWYRAYNNYDFPCPKPVGQLILRLPFVTESGKVSCRENPREVVLTAENGDKKLQLKIFVSAVRNVIVIQGSAQRLQPGDLAIRLWRHRDTILPGGEVHPTLGGGNSPKDFEQLAPPRAGQNDDLFWVAQDFPGEATFPDGFTASLVCSAGDVAADYEMVEGTAGLGTPMVAPQEGRIAHGLTKRFTPINESPGACATATLRAIPESFVIYATAATTQDDSDPLSHAAKVLAEAKALGVDALWTEHVRQLDAYDAGTRGQAVAADGRVLLDFPWGGVPYRMRPQGYYGDVPLCSVDSTKFCYQDSGMWHADFHFNEVEATGSCI